MGKISPLAYIHPQAVIGENCEIGPFCYIDQGVVIGDNNTLMNSVTVLYGARIGNGNVIFPGAVISAVPQDLKFRGEDTTAEVGDNNKIRENVTINRGTAAKGKTVVGSNNLLMEGVHVAHDAIVGNECIIGDLRSCNDEQTARFGIEPMHNPRPIAFTYVQYLRILRHKTVYERAIFVPSPRMYDETCWFIDNNNMRIFIHYIEFYTRLWRNIRRFIFNLDFTRYHIA